MQRDYSIILNKDNLLDKGLTEYRDYSIILNKDRVLYKRLTK